MQSLLGIFVESSLGDKKQDTQTAVKFLDDQIKRYEELLLAAESRLKDFKLKYLGVADQGGPGLLRAHREAADAIENARLEVQSAEQARDSYKKELAGEIADAPVRHAGRAPGRSVAGNRRTHRQTARRSSTTCGASTPTSIPTCRRRDGSSSSSRSRRHAELDARRKAAPRRAVRQSRRSIAIRCFNS